jgi:hypothetical protein
VRPGWPTEDVHPRQVVPRAARADLHHVARSGLAPAGQPRLFPGGRQAPAARRQPASESEGHVDQPVLLADRAGLDRRLSHAPGGAEQLRVRVAHVEAGEAASLVLAHHGVSSKAVLDLAREPAECAPWKRLGTRGHRLRLTAPKWPCRSREPGFGPPDRLGRHAIARPGNPAASHLRAGSSGQSHQTASNGAGRRPISSDISKRYIALIH